MLCVATSAAAQSPRRAPSGAADQPISRLPEVRIIAPPPVDVLPGTSTPSRVDTITRDDVTTARPSGLPELLERLPGVTLQNEQGNRFQRDVTIRGFTVSSAVAPVTMT